jgi:hypothetical protein
VNLFIRFRAHVTHGTFVHYVIKYVAVEVHLDEIPIFLKLAVAY